MTLFALLSPFPSPLFPLKPIPLSHSHSLPHSLPLLHLFPSHPPPPPPPLIPPCPSPSQPKTQHQAHHTSNQKIQTATTRQTSHHGRADPLPRPRPPPTSVRVIALRHRWLLWLVVHASSLLRGSVGVVLRGVVGGVLGWVLGWVLLLLLLLVVGC